MKTKTLLTIAGGALAAGAVTYLYTTQNGKRVREKLQQKSVEIKNQSKQKANVIASKLQEAKESAQKTVQNKVADAFIENKETVMKVATTIFPLVLNRILTKK